MDHGKTWQPFQYYSADCRAVFGRQKRAPISRANEQEPLCLNEYDQNADKATTRIAFSTLADRPSAEEFENSPVLQVSATFIIFICNPGSLHTIKPCIKLAGINTFLA